MKYYCISAAGLLGTIYPIACPATKWHGIAMIIPTSFFDDTTSSPHEHFASLMHSSSVGLRILQLAYFGF